jgi:phosphoribosylglycinamide formyltransferase-1
LTASNTPLPVVVLISGQGSNLQALIDGQLNGELNIDIRAVISNTPDAPGLERARRAGIATDVCDHRGYAERADYDARLRDRVAQYAPGLVVLAGFMRILTPVFVEPFQGRLINIHPSLLPDFRGLDTHRRALQAGVAEHGCSVHFVTPELDAGPVIVQARVPVHPDDDETSLERRVQAAEHRAYPQAVAWIAEARVQWQDGEILFEGQPCTTPPQLSLPIAD